MTRAYKVKYLYDNGSINDQVEEILIQSRDLIGASRRAVVLARQKCKQDYYKFLRLISVKSLGQIQ